MVCALEGDLHHSAQKSMKTLLNRSIAKSNQRQTGFTLIELLVAISIVGILGSLALPSFTGTLDKTRSSNAKQFALDAAKDCSTSIIWDNPIPTITQDDAGSDFTLVTYNCIEEGSVVTEGGTDRWTIVIDEDGIPEFPVKTDVS